MITYRLRAIYGLDIPGVDWNDYPGAVAIAYVTFAASLALMLVLLLNFTLGPIEFSGLGFSFKGASGPVGEGKFDI